MKKYLCILYNYEHTNYIAFIINAKTYKKALEKGKFISKFSEIYDSSTITIFTDNEICKMKELVNFYERNKRW